MHGGGGCGGPTRQKALVAYPGETVTAINAGSGEGFWYMPWDYSPYSTNNYYTIAKLTLTGGGAPFGNVAGDYIRIVGCSMHDFLDPSDSGIVTLQSSQGSAIYGNLFQHNGYSSMEHDLYVQTQTYTPRAWVTGDHASQQDDIAWNEVAQYVTNGSGADFFISGHQTDVTYQTNSIWVHHNYFYDGQGTYIYVDDNFIDHDVFVCDNLLVNGQGNGNGGLMVENTCTDCWFYSNTIYLASKIAANGSFEARGTVGSGRMHFANNIWYGDSGEPPFIQSGLLWTLASDHDLFYNNGSYSAPSTNGLTVTNA